MRILVTPEKLRAMAQQFQHASRQLHDTGSRIGGAYSRMDAEARSASGLGGRVRHAQTRAQSLAGEAEAMARYLERKAQEFENADRQGANDISISLARVSPIWDAIKTISPFMLGSIAAPHLRLGQILNLPQAFSFPVVSLNIMQRTLLGLRNDQLLELRTIIDPSAALNAFARNEKDGLQNSISDREQELRRAYEKAGLKAPKDTDVYSSNTVVNTILLPENIKTIENTAKRYNIPSDLLAGVVAAEMDFDHDITDKISDGIGRRNVSIPFIGNGEGVASVHRETLDNATKYLVDKKLPGYESAEKYDMGVSNRSSFSGSVESAAIVVGALVDYKGGVTSVTDKAVIWGAYRAGVKGFSPESATYGYDSQENFKGNLATGTSKLPEQFQIGGNAYMSRPYFTFFQQAFELKQRTEQRNQDIIDHPFVAENLA
jgi:hypothetical protein